MSTVDLHPARTVAESVFVAAQADPDRVALRYKADGQWRDETVAELAGRVRALTAGLIASGVRPGERVCILGDTRPGWTYLSLALLAAGAVVVPIYPSSSVEDCAWVLRDSGATRVFCDAEHQRAKASAAEAATVLGFDAIPSLCAVGSSSVSSMDAVRARLDALTPADLAVIIYTSGTTGPPKGCVLTHQNWLTLVRINDELNYVRRDDVVYLFLPLAHVFAQLEQFACLGAGATLVYFGGDIKQVVAEIAEVRPTFLPSVPRIFEKLYTVLTGALDEDTVRTATQVGWKYRSLQRAGNPIPDELAAAFDRFEPLYARVRAVFGGQVRQALSGAAPIAPEVLTFFHAAGVPVLEGYGMTETTGVGTVSTLDHFKIGSVGRAGPSIELRIAPDGEILARGPHLFAGYWHNDAATAEIIDPDGWLHTGDLGTMDPDGFVTITGRKKDIIITAGGKNIAPANFENELRQSRWISHAIMIGDRRPYPVALITLDADETITWARARDLPTDLPTLATHPEVRTLIQDVLDKVNTRHANVEQIKRFAILPRDLSIDHGELTPSLKVKRKAVHANHTDLIDSLYT
ncbi:MAG TPA: AMP-dependent synthetase/ligase [Actinophytocola sp.]|jgi:long-chain acyl-CoA synthetase|uniref:AMP-dependent synthetase/ligase n=1 Tax=Actinophytocola sp. TaxID=1872138 RepID=UPI002E05B788|nr:AMP-dependent synthetase/ligase [Actinophytocola sp.]